MNRLLTIDEAIYLNQYSQRIHSLDDMNTWFNKYDLLNKRDIMKNLFNLVVQSHPVYDDVASAVLSLKMGTSTSAVMLLNKNKPFEKFGYRICDLPEAELLNGFDILLLTLSTADNRRKSQECPTECGHWWHKDLSNPEYLESLRHTYVDKK